MPASSFDDLSDIFDAMIDWPKRLGHEEPFYRKRFAEAGVQSVLDAACGTGRHAAMFHSWGLRVEGADISPKMIARARTTFGDPAGLSWVVRGYDQPVQAPGSFDAAVCVGNSLALAPDLAIAGRAVEQIVNAMRPGGLVVLHVLNAWALPDGPCVWQTCKRAALPQGEALVIKGVHRSAAQALVELLVADPAGKTALQTQSVPFLALETADLERPARSAGASQVNFFGGYRDQPFVRQQSVDLVMVAKK